LLEIIYFLGGMPMYQVQPLQIGPAKKDIGLGGRRMRLAGMSEFLAFKLGTEEYCIDIHRVQEIRSYEVPTRLVNAPDFMKGVVNLRGSIVPIVDMRLKFDLPLATYNSLTVVIVLNVGARVIGMVVDGVSDVVSLCPEALLPAPGFAAKIDSDCVLAIGSVMDRMLIVLDIEQLMLGPAIGLTNQSTH
jgi:purine-binding chemotaxis protein CheW